MSPTKQALRICARTGLLLATLTSPLACAAPDRPRPPVPAKSFDAAIPIAYYHPSLTFTGTTAGFTPPLQSRAYAYMGIALYEAVQSGMPGYARIAPQLNRAFTLPRIYADGTPHRHRDAPAAASYHWALTANAALAEVSRGTPRRMSLKRRAPASSSRTINSVQRSASTSEASATGQN